MSELEAMKALSPETKALVLVSEFELRRMPAFQLRAALDALAPDAEERKSVVDMAERSLREAGHPPEQVAAFLTGLFATAPPQPLPRVSTTLLARRLRAPSGTEADGAGLPPQDEAAPKAPLPGMLRGTAAQLVLTGQPSGTPAVSAPAAPAGAARQPQSPPAQPPQVALGATGPQERATFASDERGNPVPVPAAPPAPPPPPPRVGVTPPLESSKPLPQQGVASEVRVTAKAVAAKPLVLIAIADKRARIVFRLRLEEDGFQVVECSMAGEAWQRIGEGGVAVTILDMALPGTSMSGADVLSKIASTFPGMAVAVLGVKDEQQAEQLRRTHRRLRCLESPAAPDMLARVVRELLNPQWVARQP